MNKTDIALILKEGFLEECTVTKYNDSRLLIIPDWVAFKNKGAKEDLLVFRFFYRDLYAMTIFGECPILPNIHPCFLVNDKAIFYGKIDTDTNEINPWFPVSFKGDRNWGEVYLFFKNFLTSNV